MVRSETAFVMMKGSTASAVITVPGRTRWNTTAWLFIFSVWVVWIHLKPCVCRNLVCMMLMSVG